jgi:hypothetical protein
MARRHTTVAPYDVVLELALNRAELEAIARRMSAPDLLDNAGSLGATTAVSHNGYKPGSCTCSGGVGINGQHYVIWVNPAAQRRNVDLIRVIAHEATHAGVGVLDDVNARYSGKDSEALAYLVDWITAWCWQQAKAPRRKG